jgi:hypothetical protein
MRLIGRRLLSPTVVLATLLFTPVSISAQTRTIDAVVDLSPGPATSHIAPLTIDGIREALLLASDESAARRFLKTYVIWTHAGWGDGPLIGSFSTPFSRVVRAALNARAAGRTLTAEEIPASLLAPEVQVIAMAQPASGVAGRSNVERIVFVRRLRTSEELIEPLRIVPFTQRYQDADAGSVTNAAVMAVFPLEALAAATEIRVQFDRTARGSSAMATCQSCVMPLRSGSIR